MILHSFRQKLPVIALIFQCISVLCGTAFLGVALLWLLQKPFWFLKQSNFEQTTVILGFITTLIGGISQYLRSQARNLRVTSSQAPIAQHPTLWMPTNHSKARIDYVAVRDRDQKSEFDGILRKYSPYVGTFYRIDLVDEVSGTLNYRVKGIRRKPILLRIHNRITSELALNTLQSIQQHMFENDIFSDSPFNDCLIPLPSVSGKKYELFGDKFIEVYPFADNVTHFPGENLAQVRSLAQKYGSVQKALQTLDPSLDFSLINHLRPNISWFEGDESVFDLICENNRMAIKGANPDRFTIIFNQYQDFLREIWHEVEPQLAHIRVRPRPLLHDFHPHNTFFQDDTCVLIYDYEAVSRYWSEAEALAFAIHRFTREYIRSLKDRRYPAAEAEIPKVVDIFLECYELGGMSVPSNFPGNLSLDIQSSNLAKLLGIMAYNYRILEDPANRSEDIWYDEIIKFIAYLQEAKYFYHQ